MSSTRRATSGCERTVALKTMSSLAKDETARKRFWREARAAASVNHPNICQIYEIGEEAGQLFIAMELLEGEVLADRLRRGPMSAVGGGADRSGHAGCTLSSALARHRPSRPQTVERVSDRPRRQDAGLRTRAARTSRNRSTRSRKLTRAGMVVGTPRYMAPEQAAGETVDARSDLFAAGAILFEMLAGRPAFAGRSIVEVLHATRYEQPPALTGSPAVAAVDRVIRRALAKRPAERPPSAEAMAEELRAISGVDRNDTAVLAQPLTRLVVLPFRVLRSDPETDFLAFSLPDAISTSLSGIRSLVAALERRRGALRRRSPGSQSAGHRGGRRPCGNGHAAAFGRSVARCGAAGRGARRNAADVSHRSVIDGRAVPTAGRHRAQRVVEALSLPLAGGAPSPTPDAPHDARGYELYLRANELARTYAGLVAARDLYQQCVELDPASRRHGLAWAGATASSANTSKCCPTARSAPRMRSAAPSHSIRAFPSRTSSTPIWKRTSVMPQQAMVRLLRRGQSPRQRSGAFRRARPRLPLLRPLRTVPRRARRGAPARSEYSDRLRTDVADDRRRRSADGRRTARNHRRRRRWDSSHGARHGRTSSTKRASGCS